MDRGMNKIVIVTRKTRLVELIHKYNTLEQAKFYIEHLGVDFSDYMLEDEKYNKAVALVTQAAEKYARVQVVDRDFVPTMIFGAKDIVVAVGQDGLVANTMKYLDGQPLIGVNPDTNRWDGVLLAFEAGEMEQLFMRVTSGNYQEKQVTIAQASTKDGQSMLAVNDFFIGQRTHVSARYDIHFGGAAENQSSSGIIVSTGLGATGWYKSIVAETQRVAASFGESQIRFQPMGWSDNRLKFVVREPYPSRSTQAGIVCGEIENDKVLKVISKMPENGVVFSDGVEKDAIEFVAGMEVTVSIAPKKGKLVVK